MATKEKYFMSIKNSSFDYENRLKSSIALHTVYINELTTFAVQFEIIVWFSFDPTN